MLLTNHTVTVSVLIRALDHFKDEGCYSIHSGNGLFTLAETWLHLERAKRELKGLRDELAGANKMSDILFLLDSTGTLAVVL